MTAYTVSSFVSLQHKCTKNGTAWFYNAVHLKNANGIANSADSFRSSLIRVCTVCSDLSVPIVSGFMVDMFIIKACSYFNVYMDMPPCLGPIFSLSGRSPGRAIVLPLALVAALAKCKVLR